VSYCFSRLEHRYWIGGNTHGGIYRSAAKYSVHPSEWDGLHWFPIVYIVHCILLWASRYMLVCHLDLNVFNNSPFYFKVLCIGMLYSDKPIVMVMALSHSYRTSVYQRIKIITHTLVYADMEQCGKATNYIGTLSRARWYAGHAQFICYSYARHIQCTLAIRWSYAVHTLTYVSHIHE
jgi:hypothetical protein